MGEDQTALSGTVTGHVYSWKVRHPPLAAKSTRMSLLCSVSTNAICFSVLEGTSLLAVSLGAECLRKVAVQCVPFLPVLPALTRSGSNRGQVEASCPTLV